MKKVICPRCNSPKVELDRRAWVQATAVKLYLCKNCGHSGYLFPQIEIKDLNELKKIKVRKLPKKKLKAKRAKRK